MRLTIGNAASYLMARRVIDASAIVDGSFMASDASRRNRNIKVRLGGESGLFLKQIQSTDPQDIASLEREATCYDLSRLHPELALVGSIMPRIRFYDRAMHILVADLISDGESLYLYHQRTQTYPLSIAVALGSAMAHLHAPAIAEHLGDPQSGALFHRMPPWILSTHEMSPSELTPTVSAANRQLIQLVQRYPGFGEALTALRAEWQTDSLIHGDMKWDNCVLTWPNATDELPRITFVDWELADLGDACWDVGAIFQAYLSEWVSSIPHTSGASPSQLERLATIPLSVVQPAIRAFWDRYAEQRELLPDDRSRTLDRCMRSAGARMIQTAYESLSYAQSLTPQMILLLQVSLNILTRPREALVRLLDVA